MAKDDLSIQEQKDAMYAEIMERVQSDLRAKEEARNRRSFQYGGRLASCNISKPSQKFSKSKDEHGKEVKTPILDEQGQPTFWDSSYYCVLEQLGSSCSFVVPLDLGKDLSVGLWYEFSGDKADDSKKDKVKVIVQI